MVDKIDKVLTLEQSIVRLEQIAAILSDNDVELDKAMELYIEAAQLIELSNKKIDEAKLKVHKLFAKEEAGSY